MTIESTRLPLGTKTAHGIVVGWQITPHEKFYMLDADGAISLMPASTLEAEETHDPRS